MNNITDVARHFNPISQLIQIVNNSDNTINIEVIMANTLNILLIIAYFYCLNTTKLNNFLQ